MLLRACVYILFSCIPTRNGKSLIKGARTFIGDRDYFLLSYLQCLRALCFFSLAVVFPVLGEVVDLKNGKVTLQDSHIWRELPASIELANIASATLLQPLQTGYEHLPIAPSLGGESGSYITKLLLKPSADGRYFVVINANFIDIGLSAYVSGSQTRPQIEVFSQLADDATPHLLHFQSFAIQVNESETVELWLVIKAKQFPTPVSISFYDPATFYEYQIYNNGLSIAAITTMTLLALLAILVYLSTKKRVALTCAGYLGLHGIGWAAASGLLDDLFNIPTNSTYWGMMLFPFAIACAGQFVSDLFDCPSNHKKLFRFLRVFSVISVVLGVTMWFLPFTTGFLISHLLAMVWMILTLSIGVTMLKIRDFRAKYFLTGNLLYSASLGYYISAHSHYFGELPYSESAVVVALSVDCICILLCLAEWFKLQQIEFNRNYYLSRTDAMTKLGNRFALSECIEQLNGFYVVVYVDLDGLKTVNDRNGHQEGDKLIVETARLMQRSFSHRGSVFRSGGDEFVSILHAQSAPELEELTKSCRSHMDALSYELSQAWRRAGVSFGIATSVECDSAKACIFLADKRMYQYKSINKKMA